jgi:signal transduction histidine kinase
LTELNEQAIDEAAKYSPRDGTVGVALTQDQDKWRLSVCDKGPGIPVAFQPHVFERFAQAGGADKRLHAGSGLGLSIVKGLVRRFMSICL